MPTTTVFPRNSECPDGTRTRLNPEHCLTCSWFVVEQNNHDLGETQMRCEHAVWRLPARWRRLGHPAQNP
eukprot:8697410-Lingulodinium_polyedra.AAC.1